MRIIFQPQLVVSHPRWTYYSTWARKAPIPLDHLTLIRIQISMLYTVYSARVQQ